MSFWTIVGAVIVAHFILAVVKGGLLLIAEWAKRKVAKDQMDEIRTLADFIVKQNKQNSTK